MLTHRTKRHVNSLRFDFEIIVRQPDVVVVFQDVRVAGEDVMNALSFAGTLYPSADSIHPSDGLLHLKHWQSGDYRAVALNSCGRYL